MQHHCRIKILTFRQFNFIIYFVEHWLIDLTLKSQDGLQIQNRNSIQKFELVLKKPLWSKSSISPKNIDGPKTIIGENP